MYRIKTNGKYVLLINDLNISISYDNENGITLTDEQFENSNDIKKVIRYLHVEKDADSSVATIKKVDKVEKEVPTAFVAKKEEEKQPDDVYIKNPNQNTSMEFSNINEETKEDKSEKIVKEIKENLSEKDNSEKNDSEKDDSKKIEESKNETTAKKRGRKK